MDDALLVRRFEGIGDLFRDGKRFDDWEGAPSDVFRQGGPIDQLHHQGLDATLFFEPVNLGDVGVVQRGEQLRFALQPAEALGIARKRVREHLHRDAAFEPGVCRSVYLPHRAGADEGGDLKWTDSGPGSKSQVWRIIRGGEEDSGGSLRSAILAAPNRDDVLDRGESRATCVRN